MSFLHHPLFPKVLPFLRVEYVGRDPRVGKEKPRGRIECDDPPDGRQWLLAIVDSCVACGQMIHKIRERGGRGALYFAATCEDGLSGSCSKGHAARAEYARIIEAIEGKPIPPPEPSLFDLIPKEDR